MNCPSEKCAQCQVQTVIGVRAKDKYVYDVHNELNPDPQMMQYRDNVLLCKSKSQQSKSIR